MSKRCYYEMLEVTRTANDGELKTAYRKLAMQWHPDRNPGDKDCEHKFKEINEAYDVLKDGDKRAAYDRFGHAAFENGHGGGARTASARISPRPSPISSKACSAWAARAARARRAASAARICATTWRSRSRMPSRQDRRDAHPDLGHLRSLLGHRRQARHQAEDLRDLRRRRKNPPRAGLLHAGAHLPALSWPRPGDRRSLQVLLGLGPRHARAHAVGQYSGRRRGRHPHPPRRRRRSRLARRAGGRPLYFPLARPRMRSSSATAPICIAACRSRW